MTPTNVLDFASLFLFIATPEDIEHERQRLEALHGMQLAVFDVEHPTRSGTVVTRVMWCEAA